MATSDNDRDDRLDRYDWNAKTKSSIVLMARFLVHNCMWVKRLSSKRLVSRLHCPRVAFRALPREDEQGDLRR